MLRVPTRLRVLLGLPLPFHKQDFVNRERLRDDYQILAQSILKHVRFDSVMDVGCANGFLLAEFSKAGKRPHGVELSREVVDVLPPELRRVVQLGGFSAAQGTYDLVCCVEVAEHIHARKSKPLVKKLTELALETIYFTAAPPGQRGHGHINCRPHEDWLAMFAELGWSCDWNMTGKIRRDLEQLRIAGWLRGNSLILSRPPASDPARLGG
jgi:hypothetical protein